MWKSACARSARTANSTLIRPIEMAPAQKTMRGSQMRRETHIACERRNIGCFREMRAMSDPVVIDPA
ncbi:hypothetical protein LJR234_005753 [Mesorhizobium amorphae]|uniref:hypothetical protein n=1 Tax=Mesorhizobium amorphae TaxID=71433 RepID=UPI003ECEB09A